MNILKFKLFEGISENSKQSLKKMNILTREFCSNELVLSKNSDLKHVLFIDKGCLKACEYRINGKEIVSSYYFAGDAFPFYLYFGNTKKYPYDIYATKKTRVYFLNLKEFEKIMDKDIKLTNNILRFVAEYTCFNKLVIRATQYQKVSQRLAYWLLHIDEVDDLKLPTSQMMLSDILRVNRPSLNQELKKLCDNDTIEMKGMEIEIKNPEYLVNLID